MMARRAPKRDAGMTDERLAEIEARQNEYGSSPYGCGDYHCDGGPALEDIADLLAEVRRLRAALRDVSAILEGSCDYGGDCRAIPALIALDAVVDAATPPASK